MVFIGSAALWRDHEHFYVNFLEIKLQTRRVGVYHLLFVEALSILFLSLFLCYSILFTNKAFSNSPLLRESLSIPSAGFIRVGYSIRNLIRQVLELTQGARKAFKHNLTVRRRPGYDLRSIRKLETVCCCAPWI
jgi:TRAP-type C4-dicarboxylate transport system permease small subunit